MMTSFSMTKTDKEKLRMAKNLVKANNKKIKEAVNVIDEIMGWYPSEENPHIQRTQSTFTRKDLERIKKILEK